MTGARRRRLVLASAVAAVLASALLPGAGLGSATTAVRGGAQRIPAGLAAAIHARFGARTIRPSSAATSSLFPPVLGVSVALSADGTTALVGAPGVGHDNGAAYIFHVSDAGAWSSTQTPSATLATQHDPSDPRFGSDVALSADGTTAFVGAPDLGGGEIPPGAIYVFHVSAEDAWASSSTPAATLTVSGDSIGDPLAVSPDGTTLVAGAFFFNDMAGGAYVFHVASEDVWASTSTPTASLSNADETRDDFGAGEAVAMSGDGTTALVSDAENSNGGGAYLFHVSAENAWTTSTTPTAVLSDANTVGGDGLGSALALSGDGTVALLGAPLGDSNVGVADVFHASGEAAWATTSTPTASLTNAGDPHTSLFGQGVALSSDGTTALVTAPFSGKARGAAYLFHVSSEGAWASSSTPTATLTHSVGHAEDILGFAAALSADGGTALVGAPGVRFLTGAADVFHTAAASDWASSSSPTAILTDSALDQCVVPKLKGRTVRTAKSALKASSCRLGKVKRVHAKGKKGRVVSQSRKPGSRLAAGTKVNVKIAK